MKVRMIYLAAGNSRRFGDNKLYHEISGRPMFAYGLETLLKVLDSMDETSLTVVTNYARIREYTQKCMELRARRHVGEQENACRERIQIVGSPESRKGISHSIRAGLAYPDADYYLFCVADQPGIRVETVIRLIQETIKKGCVGGFVEWEGESANPAVFSKALLPELMALSGDTGGKKLLTGREGVCRVRAGGKEELEDIDVKPNVF